MIKTILTVVFILVCIALTVVVLLQEGKASLGSLAGGNDSNSFWGKNKSRSAEGKLAVITKVLAAVFILLALLLNMNLF